MIVWSLPGFPYQNREKYLNDNIVVFDGECILCSSFIQFVLRQDKKAVFKFAPFQADVIREQLFSRGIDADNVETVYLLQKDAFLEKSAAVIEILVGLGGIWKGAGVFKLLPRGFRDWLYDLIAANRFRLFGKRDACFVPDDAVRSRFLF